jgi:hypothetical protein
MTEALECAADYETMHASFTCFRVGWWLFSAQLFTRSAALLHIGKRRYLGLRYPITAQLVG